MSSNVNPCALLSERDRQADYSRFVQRVRRRYSAELPCLPPGEPVLASMQACLADLRGRGLPMQAALRVLRQLVMERLVVLDCEQGAPLAVVTRAVTELAELALDEACKLAYADLDELHGAPQFDTAHGTQRAQLWVIGMGKLGARELNVSSDIDLIYVYDQDGETAGNADGRNRISHHEYFAKAVKHLYSTVGETTEHGNVFRVDLALRPNGNSGPPAVSLGALEEYFMVQGREWERFAWLKGRVISRPVWASAAQFEAQLRALDSADLPLPFITPKPQGQADASVALVKLAVARSGDKGNHSNIGVMARSPDYLPWIAEALTPEVVVDWMSHVLDPIHGRVERWYLPGTHSLNFLLENALGGGGVASLRIDPQGKAFAQQLLEIQIPVPQSIAEQLD